jgi:3-oxoacyl-[acyl-carrier protein] reductase
MTARRWGRIVNISSGAARGPGLLGVVYNASKAGLEGLTRGYASRTAKDGITVNAIAPGPTDTEMGAPLKAGGVEARIPVGRMGKAEDVAQAAVMVIGNGFITRQTIAVNGGLAFL